MKKNLLNKHVTDLLHLVEQELNAYLLDKKPEHLHTLRVAIKKIKAVFSFTKKVYQEDYNPNMLKPLFREAGIIREIQMHIELLNQLSKPPVSFINQLKKKEITQTKLFITKIPYHIELIQNSGKNLYLPTKLPEIKLIENYFKKEKKKTKKLIKTKDREDLHWYRIRIKKMLYVYNAMPQMIQKEIELNEKKINKDQIKLGKWHDTYMAIEYLTHIKLSKNMTEQLIQLKEKEKKEFNNIFKKTAHR